MANQLPRFTSRLAFFRATLNDEWQHFSCAGFRSSVFASVKLLRKRNLARRNSTELASNNELEKTAENSTSERFVSFAEDVERFVESEANKKRQRKTNSNIGSAKPFLLNEKKTRKL